MDSHFCRKTTLRTWSYHATRLLPVISHCGTFWIRSRGEYSRRQVRAGEHLYAIHMLLTATFLCSSPSFRIMQHFIYLAGVRFCNTASQWALQPFISSSEILKDLHYCDIVWVHMVERYCNTVWFWGEIVDRGPFSPMLVKRPLCTSVLV